MFLAIENALFEFGDRGLLIALRTIRDGELEGRRFQYKATDEMSRFRLKSRLLYTG